MRGTPGPGMGSAYAPVDPTSSSTTRSKLVANTDIPVVPDFKLTDMWRNAPSGADWSTPMQEFCDAIEEDGLAGEIPAGSFKLTETIRLPSHGTIIGHGTHDNVGTRILSYQDDGTPCFDSAQNNYLSHFRMEGIQILKNGVAPGSTGTGDCFHVYGITNNSAIRNVEVRNFRGHAFCAGKQTLVPGDDLAISNTVFEQFFATSCGGYGLKADGYVVGVATMCDFNSNVGGAVHFLNGVNNQSIFPFIACWFENTRDYASLQPVLLEDMGGQLIPFIGCTFTGRSGSTDAVKVIGATGAKVALRECNGFGYTNWINDDVANWDLSFSEQINYTPTVSSQQITAEGSSPIIDIRLRSGGTANRRWWRESIAGENLVVAQRNDDGSFARNVLSLHGVDGEFEIINALKADKSVILPRVSQTLASNGAVTIDASASSHHVLMLQANATSSTITNPTTDQRLLKITVLQDATGGRTFSWPTSCKFQDDTPPVDLIASGRVSVTFWYDGTNWREEFRAPAAGVSKWMRAGTRYVTWGNGDPTRMDVLANTGGVAGPQPTQIGATVVRAVKFRLPRSIAVSNIYLFPVGSVADGYIFGILPTTQAEAAIWISGAVTTVNGVWLNLTTGLPVTLLGDMDYWWCMTNNNSAGATTAWRTPPPAQNTGFYGASSGPLSALGVGMPELAQFATTSGAMPVTTPAVAAAAFAGLATGSIPPAILAGTAP